ncbi:MAG: 6,7-dimethyl-8-ribityllumazine synthase [Verrucomicrobiota bacterium]|nr:6,7-dimethyl-8-ribityllumazine synthase [Verrucomicrobiota bacterium]
MLQKVKKHSGKSGGRFAIVAARYNSRFTDALVKNASKVLKTAGASVEVFRVPGSFEIPAVAARLAESTPPFDAIVCFGAILRGATTHADHIAISVSHALAQLQLNSKLPIIHGVLLFESEEQAVIRCLGKEHNRGIEAAGAALEMAALMAQLKKAH